MNDSTAANAITRSFIQASLALLLVSPAAAAESKGAESDLSLNDLMGLTITTVSKRKEKPSEAPATVYILTNRDIRDRGYGNLKDVLADLPGMETIENYFSEDGTLVPVRGVTGNNKIIVMVNNVRVNPPGGEDFPLRSDFSVRDAEQIEIVYGPGSTLYGQDAINAVINIKTKSPEVALSAEALAIGGSGRLKEGYLSLGKKLWFPTGKEMGLSFYLQGQMSDLDDFSRTHPEWWASYKDITARVGAGGKPKRWDDGFNGMVRLQEGSTSFQLWHRESSRSSSEGGYSPILQFVDEAVWHDRTTVLNAANTLEISENLELETSLTFARYEIDPETRYVFPVSDSTFYLNDYKYGVGTGVNWEERLGLAVSDRLYLTSGFAVSSNDILPKATVPGGADPSKDISAQAGTFTYYTRKNDLASVQNINKVNVLMYQNFGAYLEGQWQALPRFKLISGFRFDVNSRFQDVAMSPRLAAVYEIIPGLVFKYIYSQAYVAPAPYFGYNNYDNGQSINIANPDLHAERAKSNEVNLLYTFSKAILSASLYRNDNMDLIITGDQTKPLNIISDTIWLDTTFTTVRKLTHSANSGRSVSQGLDLSVKMDLGRYRAWISYSLIDFSSTVQGVTSGMDKLARNQIRAGVTSRFFEKMTATVSLSYRTTPENIGDDPQWAAYTSQDPYEIKLFAAYNLSKAFHIQFGMDNVTDNRYVLKGVLGPTPQEGRKFNLGLGYTF
ncbi:MAG: TonB-dependent receptor [Fibrobacterota bacterium]|nr:TonB-dependent receptor [Fibrobacterota bacterium]